MGSGAAFLYCGKSEANPFETRVLILGVLELPHRRIQQRNDFRTLEYCVM